MKKKFSSGMNVGSSSILVIFVLLCLVCFAALSFLSANSDYKLSLQTAERTTKYYEANSKAELYLANIEGLLSKLYASNIDKDTYFDSIDELFSDNDMVIVSNEDDKIYLSYNIPINNMHDLSVKLLTEYPEAPDYSLFSINEWKTVTNQDFSQSLTEEFDNQNKQLMEFD